MEKIFLDINGHSVYVEATGRGAPILLMNGLGGDPKILEKLRDNLPNNRVITFDPPGVGRSSDIKWPLKISNHAKVAASVLKELNLTNVTAFGVSWGGTVAQELAYQSPDLVSNLILVSTMPGPLLITKPSVLLNRYIKTMFGSKAEWMQVAAIFGWTSIGYLQNVSQPTLIVSGGEDDLVLPYNARLLHLLMPNAKLELFDDADHWLVVTKAEALASLMQDFINK